jgi:hypothetical protein
VEAEDVPANASAKVVRVMSLVVVFIMSGS